MLTYWHWIDWGTTSDGLEGQWILGWAYGIGYDPTTSTQTTY